MLVKQTIALGADHRGFVLKKKLLDEMALFFVDCGAFSADRSDYPIFAQAVVAKILEKEAGAGILLCGTGAGMAMAANRTKGIRAAVAWNEEIAQRVKEEDNCNVLVLPADYVTPVEAQDIVSAWLGATFKEGRYAKRLGLIDG